MIIDLVMPQMGESIVEGTIVKWLKTVGDSVEKDEIILEISTDKVDSEIPSSATGVINELLAQEGDTIEVGKVIARISTDGETAKEQDVSEPAEEASSTEIQMPKVTEESQKRPKKFLSPLVKKIAKEHNIEFSELDALSGSGTNGRVTKSDILAFIDNRKTGSSKEEPAEPPTSRPVSVPASAPVVDTAENDVEITPMDHVRKKIAEHMVMSKHTAPHVTSVAEVDVTRIVNYREKIKKSFEQREGAKITFTSFFVDVVARALKQYPLLNSSVDGDNIIQKKYINIGIAVGMDKGLIVPVIKNADQLSLVGIAKRVVDLANRARSKKLKPDDVQGGTFSITNIGTFGNIFGTPIINQPQVGILGTGAIKKRPVVVEDDMIAIRSMMYISLTYDHRIIDGLYAGQFLQLIRESLENYDTSI